MRTVNSKPQLETLIDEIRGVARSGEFLWLPLMGALSLIDTSLERPDTTVTTGVGKRFKEWLDTNLTEYSNRPFGQVDRPGYFDLMAGADMTVPPKGELNMTSESIWQFRCSLLHEGTTDLDEHGDFDKILFARRVQDSVLRVGDDKYAVTDMMGFTDTVCNAAERWLANSRDTEPVRTNLTRLLSLTPHRFLGMLVG